MTREDTVFVAQLAEAAERYDDMVDIMKEIASEGRGLSEKERNLLAAAYKNAIGSRRVSWGLVGEIELMEDGRGDRDLVALVGSCRHKIGAEITEICRDVLDITDKHLIPSARSAESMVFYHKMKSDYLRYIAEVAVDELFDEACKDAHEAYGAATEIAKKWLHPASATRLGLALNFSVFHYEIREDNDQACEVARCAFREAIAELDTLVVDNFADSTLVMHLLRDNLDTWSTVDDEDTEAK